MYQEESSVTRSIMWNEKYYVYEDVSGVYQKVSSVSMSTECMNCIYQMYQVYQQEVSSVSRDIMCIERA